MSTKRKGKKENRLESPTQYKVVDPIFLTDLEHMHTRRGKYPTRPPPFGQPTWEEAKRKKGEKLKKSRKERSPSTPLETTSTEAMDTEEAQEFGKEIVAKATQRELKKQEYIRYQQRRPQAVEYDFPKPGTIPVPQLEKSREKKEARPQSVLSNFEVPNYEEISMYSGKPSIMSRSVPTTLEPKETSLLKMIGFEAQEEVNLEPDFYMSDGKGGKLSDAKCMFTTNSTPEGSPGVVVQLNNLKEKYGASMFLLDKRSGNLYLLEAEEYKKIEEKGLLFPSESMIMAGALEREVGEPN